MDRRRQLAEALQEAVKAPVPGAGTTATSHGFRQLESRRRRNRRLLVVVLAGWALLAWLWVARPAFVFEPLQPRTLRPDQQEAALRYALYLQGARIAAFAAEHGRPPATLSEVEVVEEGLTYTTEGTTWSLRGSWESVALELTSRMSPDSFLGRSLRQLKP